MIVVTNMLLNNPLVCCREHISGLETELLRIQQEMQTQIHVNEKLTVSSMCNKVAITNFMRNFRTYVLRIL